MKKTVANYEARYDRSFWNIDSLKLRGTLGGLGSVKVILTKPQERGVIAAASMTDIGNIVALRPDIRETELIDVNGNLINRYKCKADEDFLDIANVGDDLYLLNYASQTIDWFKEYLLDNTAPTGGKKSELKRVGRWSLASGKIGRGTRLSVSRPASDLGLVICLYSIEDGSIVLMKPTGPSGKVEVTNITPMLPEPSPSLGQEIHACLDTREGSMIIADTLNHRILEVDVNTSRSRLLCGNGQPGACNEEGALCLEAPLRYPRGVALYRLRDILQPDYFSDDSSKFVFGDPKGVRPRTIIVADSGNRQLRKIVDLLEITQSPRLFSLLGSGNKPVALLGLGDKPIEVPHSDDDLRQIPVHEPHAVTVSASGEVLLRTGSSEYLLLLQPATSVPQRQIREQIQKSGGPGT